MSENLKNEVLPQRGNGAKPYTFTDLQIEAAKLKAQGYSLTQIAKKLGRKPHHISTALKKFKRTAERIRSAFQELQSAHFWDMQRDYAKATALGHEAEKQMLLEGGWPFGLNKVPFGWVVDAMRRLQFDPERESSLRRAINRILTGEAPFKVAKEEEISFDRFYRFLRNPRIKGYVPLRGEILPGKHPKYVDEETWERLQKVLDIKKTRVKFGFKHAATGKSVDEEMIPTLRQICTLRSQRKSIEKIVDTLKISKSNVCRVLDDPDYKDVVGANLWEAAHQVKIESGAPILKKFAESRKTKNDAAIILYLRDHGSAYTHQIAKAIGLSDNSTRDHLKKFKANGLVEREKKHNGKWYLDGVIQGLGA